MTEAVLECRNVVREFSEGNTTLQVLRGVNLAVRPSERLAIIGASGSGKTTLLQIMGGLDDPDEGETVRYTVNVKNNGPAAIATDIVISDVLPVGMNFVAATADGHQAQVAVHPGNQVIPHITHAAPILQTGIVHLARDTPHFQFRHGGEHGGVLALHHFLHRIPGDRTQGLHVGLQFREAEMHHLIVEDRLAESLALTCVFDRFVDGLIETDET